MKVKDIITRRVHTMPASRSVVEAAVVMERCNIGALLIHDQHQAAGMLTDRDIVLRVLAAGKDPKVTPVYDAMSSEVIHCKDDMSVEQAVLLMEKHHIRRLPVMDKERKLAGIVTAGDVARNTDYLLTGAMMNKVSRYEAPVSAEICIKH